MHNYIINDRVLFNTYTGSLSRLDNPKQAYTLDRTAKRLFLRLIDSGYQLVPMAHLVNQHENINETQTSTASINAAAQAIANAFRQLGEPGPVLTLFPNGIQLSTDVELKVIPSYRTTFNDNDDEKPYIAKTSLMKASSATIEPYSTASPQTGERQFVWYYLRIVFIAALSLLLLYFILSYVSFKPNYFADYHYQGKYQQCNLFIHDKKSIPVSQTTQRLDVSHISCNAQRNIYVSMPADKSRESYQICEGDPDKRPTSCMNYYVVKMQ